MPCYDNMPPEPPAPERFNGLLGDELEAVLCGVITTIGIGSYGITIKQFLDDIDWKEVGVSQKRVLQWWKDHQKADAESRVWLSELNDELNWTFEEIAMLIYFFCEAIDAGDLVM